MLDQVPSELSTTGAKRGVGSLPFKTVSSRRSFGRQGPSTLQSITSEKEEGGKIVREQIVRTIVREKIQNQKNSGRAKSKKGAQAAKSRDPEIANCHSKLGKIETWSKDGEGRRRERKE